MIIDPIDLKLIRLLEQHGGIPIEEVLGKFQITEEEVLLRIANFEESGFINGYGMKLFVPGLLGGKWYWGCIACETTPRFKPETAVTHLEEIVENLTIPAGVCPDMSLLFYTQNLRETYTTINKTPGIKYAEVYKIDEYVVDVPRILLDDDWHIVDYYFENIKRLKYKKIHTIMNNPQSESDIKLSRLLWSKKNRKGVVSLFPNFNWSLITNYLHLHCAVTAKLRIKDLRRIVNNLGFSGNITSRFKKRYIQLEFNIWGFSDLQTIFSALKDVGKVTVEGYSLAYKNRVYHDWIKAYTREHV